LARLPQILRLPVRADKDYLKCRSHLRRKCVIFRP
jgi:hypothetical protein